jgi:hypothetical protein
MIRIHYTEDLNKGDEVLVRFDSNSSFKRYYVLDIKDQFVGISSRQWSSNPSYHKISEIELYKDVSETN